MAGASLLIHSIGFCFNKIRFVDYHSLKIRQPQAAPLLSQFVYYTIILLGKKRQPLQASDLNRL